MLLCSGSFMCAYVSSKNNVNSLAVWKTDGKRSSENKEIGFQTTSQSALNNLLFVFGRSGVFRHKTVYRRITHEIGVFIHDD